MVAATAASPDNPAGVEVAVLGCGALAPAEREGWGVAGGRDAAAAAPAFSRAEIPGVADGRFVEGADPPSGSAGTGGATGAATGGGSAAGAPTKSWAGADEGGVTATALGRASPLGGP
jgi:hypothetical protein